MEGKGSQTLLILTPFESDVFDLDAVFYAEAIQSVGWEVRFPIESVGEKVMAVFVDNGLKRRRFRPATSST